MFQFIKKYFDFNEKEIQRLKKKVAEINSHEDKVRALKDEDFAKETEKLKKQIQSEEKTLDDILPWAYALVREASRRALGQRHFDVQLIAGIALHEGKIAEQKTGEGKTLSATTALYLNALTGRGVHLVTVNDYLARRDAGWMGKVFYFLGMKTAAIISDQSFIFDPSYNDSEAADSRLSKLKPASRTDAYLADITYGINSEFGFDYLRDNGAVSPEQLRQRGFYFAIIDEADSVLIDEARTPHIISAPFGEDTNKYYRYADIVKQLDPKTDYVIDEKLRTSNLTETGIQHIESLLGVDNVYEKDFESLFHIEAALKAATLFKKEKEYIVKDGEVIIVDEFTGRLLQGRRFSEGLHQAIEAKEKVAIQKESKTLATVSLQNYFRMYDKLAGMTGTAATETEEFHKIYKTEVLVIPTHRSMVRKDEADMIYKTEKGKYNAVVEEIITQYKTGRPVLVGTTSIEKNERLSHALKERGIPHELLNAKNHLREAQIISRAGEKGSITVATNMAGRGVDIILGGNPPDELKMTEEEYRKEKEEWQKRHDEVVALGGLYVLGTERHESRRIDNQLRGRSGRQGDPGVTCFFVSLEDDLMRIFGGEQISKLMTMLKFPEDQPLSHGMVSRALEQAQVKVEGFNFDIRKNLVEYDDVLNKQREIIYTLRRKILKLPEQDPEEFKETIFTVIDEEIKGLLQNYMALSVDLSDEELQTLSKDLEILFPKLGDKIEPYLQKRAFEDLQVFLEDEVDREWKEKEEKVTPQVWHSVVRDIFLSTLDQYWTEHLTAIEDLSEGIRLRGYAQLDPLIEYKNEAFGMFEKLIAGINFDATRRLFRVEIGIREEVVPEQKKPEPKKEKQIEFKAASSIDPFSASQKEQVAAAQPVAQHSHTHVHEQAQAQSQESQAENPQEISGFKVIPPGAAARKLGRNDPCWCGSGKKYKKCHLNREPQTAQEREAYNLYSSDPAEWQRRYGKN